MSLVWDSGMLIVMTPWWQGLLLLLIQLGLQVLPRQCLDLFILVPAVLLTCTVIQIITVFNQERTESGECSCFHKSPRMINEYFYVFFLSYAVSLHIVSQLLTVKTTCKTHWLLVFLCLRVQSRYFAKRFISQLW